MAAADFDPYFDPLLLDVEGRTLDTDPHDSGNWTGGKIGVGRLVGTKYGIDAASHASEVDIPTLTVEGAKAIYKREYAAPIRFDDLPAGVDVVTLDPAINNGVSRASGWLQAAVGAPVDNRVGQYTVDSANLADPVATIKAISARRLAFDQGLGSLFARYGNGWTARIARVEAFAVSLALAAAKLSPGEIADRLHKEAGSAAVEAKKADTKVATTGGAGAAGSVAANQTVPDVSGVPHQYVVLAVAVIAVIGVVYFMWRKHTATVRATAYASQASIVLERKPA